MAQPAMSADTRHAPLDEALKLLNEIPAEAKQLSDLRELAGWIAQEQAK